MNEIISMFTDPAFVAAVSTIIGSAVTFFVTRNNNSKQLAISDRKQLSRDQYLLISELRDEIGSLRAEVKELRDMNLTLILENRKYQDDFKKLSKKVENQGGK